MKKTRSYSQEDFIKAVESSFSIAQVLKKLEIAPCGGNYLSFHRYVQELNIDTSHFTGKGWSAGKTIGRKIEIEKYLNNEKYICSYSLKQKLLNENILPRKCNSCKLKTWLDSEIPLELHHIDGDNKNNNLDNLQILCANCHSLTHNFRGKKKSINYRKRKYGTCIGQDGEINTYDTPSNQCECGNKKNSSSKRCISCYNKSRIKQ